MASRFKFIRKQEGAMKIMTISFILIVANLMIGFKSFGQNFKFDLDEGNQAYQNKDYVKAEAGYRNALLKLPKSDIAGFNLGNSLYKQEKPEDAANQFEKAAQQAQTKEDKAKAFHNLGNCQMQSKKVKEAAESYKKALRFNPNDDDTRYNLAVAQKILKEQENQQQQNQDQNQDQKNEENQENQENQENKENQENQDQQNKENEENKENQDEKEQKNQDEKEGESKPEERPAQISKEDAQRLLQMLEEEEENTQDKLKKQTMKVRKVQVEKDW